MRDRTDGDRVVSVTTGTFSTAPTPRIATCGWLMIGVPNRLPKLPKLVMENVPPVHLVRLELPGAGARGEIDDRALQPDDVLLVRVANHGNDQAALERHGDPDVDLVVIDDVRAFDRRVHDREGAQRLGTRRAR